MKILNAYAGIGGNRKHWDGQKHDITAIEIDSKIAQIYRDNFPNDKVIETDAHEYIKENFRDFDFIWASPPCPTHSRLRKHLSVEVNGSKPVYPDQKLWQEILFLKGYFEGSFVVENVKPWYDKQVKWERFKPQQSGRHYFWANFNIPNLDTVSENIKNDCRKDQIKILEKKYGYNLSNYNLNSRKKKKLLNNCVSPNIGEAILKSRKNRQTTLGVEK